MLEEHRRIVNIMEFFSIIGGRLDSRSRSHNLLSLVGLERLALSIMRMIASVVDVGASEFPNSIRTYLFGGMFMLREREQLNRLLNEIASGDTDGNVVLDPPYLASLAELSFQIRSNGRYASTVLPLAELITPRYVEGKSMPLSDVWPGTVPIEALVLLKNIARFFAREARMPSEVFGDLLAL